GDASPGAPLGADRQHRRGRRDVVARTERRQLGEAETLDDRVVGAVEHVAAAHGESVLRKRLQTAARPGGGGAWRAGAGVVGGAAGREVPAAPRNVAPPNAERRSPNSIGNGKTTVVLFCVPIVASVF